MRVATLVALFAFFFEVVRCGDNVHNNHWAKRHNPRAALSEDVAATNQNITSLEKRVDGAKFTFYVAGLGACGVYNTGSDFIVALNAAQFNGGSHCFETITITANGKTTQATITDMCEGCGEGGLDLTIGLFTFFALQSLGEITGSWSFGGAASPSPTPTPTPTPEPRPSSSSIPTSTSTPRPTSTQSPTSSSVSTSQSHSTSDTSASVSPTPTPLIPSSAAGNIADLFLIFIELGRIATLGHGNN